MAEREACIVENITNITAHRLRELLQHEKDNRTLRAELGTLRGRLVLRSEGSVMTALVQGKKRPLVDPTVYDLARDWITENYAINADTADAASDCLEDAVWDLAAAVQRELENWLGDAESNGRLRLLRSIEPPRKGA